MDHVRPAAVAGMFYPDAPKELAADLRAYLGEAATRAAVAASSPWPKALIVPHAGYVYSGPVAASAYARLAAGRRVIKRVVLFGPTHRVPVRGLALPCARAFATPLGTVAVDQDAVAVALTLPQVQQSDAPHAMEHALEVQIPFLQAVLEGFEIAPFAVGNATPEAVAQVIEGLWGGPETLIVISSDLSHYHRYADARQLDQLPEQPGRLVGVDVEHVRGNGPDQVDDGLQVPFSHRRLELDDLDRRQSQLAPDERPLEMAGNHHGMAGRRRCLSQGQRADHVPDTERSTPVTEHEDPHQPASIGFCTTPALMATSSGRARRSATTSRHSGGASGSSATSARNRSRSSAVSRVTLRSLAGGVTHTPKRRYAVGSA